MKLTKNISFKYFKKIKRNQNLLNLLDKIKNENNQILKSLSGNYKDSFSKKKISKYKKYSNIRLIGMGGSSLGAQSIYDFLHHKMFCRQLALLTDESKWRQPICFVRQPSTPCQGQIPGQMQGQIQDEIQIKRKLRRKRKQKRNRGSLREGREAPRVGVLPRCVLAFVFV